MMNSMKKMILAVLVVLMLGASAMATIWVSGYSRGDGTYVNGYQRSTPSESFDIKGNWKD